ncbi:MAG: MazG family protein [Actinomycetia bacterium]|nr:MazG family protein [Actinomycetes bacterium]
MPLPRLTLVATSPRVAPGLLSAAAWEAVRGAQQVLAADLEDPLAVAVADAGTSVRHVALTAAGELARHLVDGALAGDLVWLGSADGDPGLTDAIAAEVSSRDQAPDVEVLVGSWDAPGSRLLDVVAAMDRLRSPGGCPWDAEQTHESLAPYLLEEAHETLEAIERGDRRHLAEELGDVLLQVVFHARVAEDASSPQDRFDIDDVAGHLVAKLIRRHPHVFADGDAETPEAVEAAWEQIKAAERAAAGGTSAGGETSDDDLLHGIPAALPVHLAADKVAARIRRRGLNVEESAQADLTQALADLDAATAHAAAALRRLALTAHTSHATPTTPTAHPGPAITSQLRGYGGASATEQAEQAPPRADRHSEQGEQGGESDG